MNVADRTTGPRSALGFLTVAGGASTPGASALPWFGPVGALIGLAVGGTYWLGLSLTSPTLAAAAAITVDLVLTGLLHIDGLGDSADGLLPPLDRERRFAVMKDPATGAFGVATVVMVLLLRVAALAAAPAAPLAVAGLWALSRTAMAFTTMYVPYARADRGGGLATAFHGERARPVVLVLNLAFATALAVVGRGGLGALAVAGGAAACLSVVLFARHRLGGFTGDVLGAAGVVGETVGLMFLAIR